MKFISCIYDPASTLCQGIDAMWTFLSNHAHVLVSIARDPTARVRDIASSVGITERAVQNILVDLEEVGVVTRVREGRRNRYFIALDHPLRHPMEDDRTVGSLLRLFVAPTQLRRTAG